MVTERRPLVWKVDYTPLMRISDRLTALRE